MRRTVSAVVGIVLIIIGMLIFLSPEIISALEYANIQVMIDSFKQEHLSEQNDSGGLISNPMRESIEAYNQSIYENEQSDFADPWSCEQEPVDLDLPDDVFGYIEIAAMDLKLPLYIGASYEHLENGAAVLGQTSIPVGGINTNSVIAGHRGWYAGKDFFLNIEKIRVGDDIVITNPWESLVYTVVKIDIINPYNSDAVKIQNGKDMVTLLTCHPYASGGRYRYVVYCERNTENMKTKPLEETYENDSLSESCVMVASSGEVFTLSQKDIDQETMIRRFCLCGMGIIFLICILISIFRKYLCK